MELTSSMVVLSFEVPALLLAFPYEVAKATILPRMLSQPMGKTALIVAFEVFVGIPIMILRVRCVIDRMTDGLFLSELKY